MATTTSALTKKMVSIAVTMLLALSLGAEFSDGAKGSFEVQNRIDDLGTLSQLQDISESNLYDDMIAEVSADGGKKFSEKMKKQLRERMDKQVNSPAGAALPRAMKNREYSFDPSVTLVGDIRDTEGNVIAKAGTKQNPLDFISYDTQICFADANDPVQINWLKEKCMTQSNSKIVLVSGNPMEAMKTLKRRVYFDQKGTLVDRFGIEAVPATVRAQGRQMAIKEYLLK